MITGLDELEAGGEDEHDLMARHAIQLKQVLKDAQQAKVDQFLPDLLSHLSAGRIGGVFTELDMTPKRSFVDPARRVRVSGHEQRPVTTYPLSSSCDHLAVTDELLVIAYDPDWPQLFAELAGRLRARLGDAALRIDHIGSTAVPGLDAKPVIDVQISVANLEPVDAYRSQIECCGFVWRANNTELTKRYFREQPGLRRTHIHVRRAGSFSEQFALLFRDYLRAHPERAAEYASLKHRLAALLITDRHGYVEAKVPFTWDTIRLADDWAQSVGWEPGPSDG
jgi:GrpB-like predicted nucleotidyltransferase (UPF0157 family)